MTPADAAWHCSDCGFRLYTPVPVSALKVTRLGLYNDSRFPGRSPLVLRDHVEHLDALDEQSLLDFWSDATTVGRELRKLLGADRINYAVLGNAEPHLHAHLIPREHAGDPPSRSPWNDPRPADELPETTLHDLRTVLSVALS